MAVIRFRPKKKFRIRNKILKRLLVLKTIRGIFLQKKSYDKELYVLDMGMPVYRHDPWMNLQQNQTHRYVGLAVERGSDGSAKSMMVYFVSRDSEAVQYLICSKNRCGNDQYSLLLHPYKGKVTVDLYYGTYANRRDGTLVWSDSIVLRSGMNAYQLN